MKLFANQTSNYVIVTALIIMAGISQGMLAFARPEQAIIRRDGQSVLVNVDSNGCTSKESFIVEELGRQGKKRLLKLKRLTPDDCKAYLPDGVVISYSAAELGLADICDLLLAIDEGTPTAVCSDSKD